MSYVSRSSWKRRSSCKSGYSSPKSRGFKGIILFIILLFLLYEVITSLFITSYRQESISMEPTIPSGALILASPVIYGSDIPFTEIRIPGIRNPKRGDLVICTPEYHPESAWYSQVLDSGIRFFTLQKKSFTSSDDRWINSRMLKRIIGIPGDTVRMEGSQVFLKPVGRETFFSENEIIQTEYTIEHYPLPDGMPYSFPLSGNMDEMKLGENEYFIMGDNRSMSNDSYYWGPVDITKIKARAILEYSPDIMLLQ